MTTKKAPTKTTKTKSSKAATQKSTAKKGASTAKKGASTAKKGAEVPATRAATKKGSTKAAMTIDQELEAVLTKMKHPIALPVQVSHPRNCVHTGLFMLDLITCGGYRKGRMYTISAHPSHGKSTLVQEALAAAQIQQLRIFHFDMEHSSARQYMARQGIVTDETYRLEDGSRGYYYLDPESGEDFYRMAGRLLDRLPRDPDPDTPPKTILVVDSYESFTSDAITDDKEPIGVFARMHSSWQKILRRKLRRAGAVMVSTNQLRTSGIGTFFIDEEDDAGGYALKFYSDCRVFIRMGRAGGNKSNPLPPNTCKGSLFVKKNRMADPFKKADDVRLILGRGYDRWHDRLMFLVTTGYIKRKGAYYIFQSDQGEKKFQYKKARSLMRKTRFIEACFQLSSKMATYEKFFALDEQIEPWEERS